MRIVVSWIVVSWIVGSWIVGSWIVGSWIIVVENRTKGENKGKNEREDRRGRPFF
jgi:hypothetical protein